MAQYLLFYDKYCLISEDTWSKMCEVKASALLFWGSILLCSPGWSHEAGLTCLPSTSVSLVWSSQAGPAMSGLLAFPWNWLRQVLRLPCLLVFPCLFPVTRDMWRT